jgi:nitroreductase
MNAIEFEQLIQNRRSNRKFDPAVEVPKVVIERSLQRAILSPNSSNMQLWEFYCVSDTHKMKEWSALCLGQSAASTAKHLVIFVTRQDLWKERAAFNLEQIKKQSTHTDSKMYKRGLQYYSKLMPLLYRQDPLGIFTLIRKGMCFFMGLRKPFMKFGGKADQRVMVHKSCALAAQTFMLSITAEGFDSCPMEGFDRDRVRKKLNLPSGAEICMIVSVGKGMPDGIYGKRYRVPFEEVVFQVD